MVDPSPALEPARSSSPARRTIAGLALQSFVWLALSLAIAAMLVVGGPFAWSDALRFSSTNWLPWTVLTPLVFWVSRRFPLVRGHLARSIPTHLVACLACTFVVSSIAQRFPLRATLPPRPTAPPAVFKLSSVDFVPHHSGALPPSSGVLQPAIGFATSPAIAAATPVFTAVPATGTFQTGATSGSVTALGPIGMLPTKAGGFVVGSASPRPTWQMMLVPLALRANVGFLVYFIVAAAAHAIGFYRHAKERERQALALVASRNQAKLDALRLQLQPHFLFNTLNAIATLVHRDARAADRLIGDLSDLLRASLQTTQHEVALASEFELLEHYLAIEQVRLGDRLRVVRDIDRAVLGASVPPLILQPLAENAIRHGFEPRLAPGTLTVAAYREADTLRLIVADDGVGFDPEARRSSRRGIGIANTRERLRTLHGDRASLVVTPQPTGGVVAEISLPFRAAPARTGPALAAAVTPA